MADIVDAVDENFCVVVIFWEVFGTNLLLGRLESSGSLEITTRCDYRVLIR